MAILVAGSCALIASVTPASAAPGANIPFLELAALGANPVRRMPLVGEWWTRTMLVMVDGRSGSPRRLYYLRDGRMGLQPVGGYDWRPINDTPGGAVRRLLVAFAMQDTAALARLLTADYRFASTAPGFAARFHGGLDRTAQLDSVTRLPETPPNQDPGSPYKPILSLLAEFPDSLIAHAAPGPGRRRQTIPLDRFTLLARSDGTRRALADSGACDFLLVRGDSAQVRGPVVAGRWYVAGWSFRSAAPGAVTRAAGERVAAHASPPALQVRCVSAIGERPASFEISMVDPAPVHAEVFDLGGRRVASRMLAEDVQEVLGFSLPGDRLASGVYWLRVTQGPHRAVTRFVILRP